MSVDGKAPTSSGRRPHADGARLRLAVEGRLDTLGPDDRRVLFERTPASRPDVAETVAALLRQVKERGDEAVREAVTRFDGVAAPRIEVPHQRRIAALQALDPGLRRSLEQAAEAIASFHRWQLPRGDEYEPRPGVRLGRRFEPLARIGAYAPGGRASYPSSVLMTVVPAKVAGVPEVVVCSPPAPEGSPSSAVMAASEIAGADRLFAVGGATAIGAMAYGTETIPRVDKVVGPGNLWVTEAKRQLAGTVESDCLAGPSEVLVVADGSADPELVTLELIAQAEHDPEAAAVLVGTDARLVENVRQRLGSGIAAQARADVVGAALAKRGALLLAASIGEALEFAAEYAPEHLLLMIDEPRAALERVRGAGSVFLGSATSVVFGDYSSGTNHVLPTGGRARAASGLCTNDFLRSSTYQEITPAAAAGLAGSTAALATAEGLPGHAAAALRRAETPAGRPAEAPRGPAGRASYARFRAYDPGRSPCEVDLSDNTNLFGLAPSARDALAAMTAADLSRYPSVYASELKGVVADRLGVATDQVATGCGSDDLIDSTLRAFCETGDPVAFPEPTFSMLPSFAHMNGAVPRTVSLGPGFALEPSYWSGIDPRAIYLCRPNNPTGTLFRRGAVDEIAASAGGAVVIVDEAYIEFGDRDESVLDLARDGTNVVVVRTLSKAWGLAGLRLGYAVGPAPLIRQIEKSRGPYKVGGVAETVAVAVLRHDEEWMRRTVAETRDNRERLAAALDDFGLRVWPSAANFLLVAAPGGDAAGAGDALRERGIGVRAFPALPEAGDCLRITIGPWPLMERLVDALRGLID